MMIIRHGFNHFLLHTKNFYFTSRLAKMIWKHNALIPTKTSFSTRRHSSGRARGKREWKETRYSCDSFDPKEIIATANKLKHAENHLTIIKRDEANDQYSGEWPWLYGSWLSFWKWIQNVYMSAIQWIVFPTLA